MTDTPSPSLALVLGIRGAIGGAIAAALAARGHAIRALVRPGSKPMALPYPVEWVTGDASVAADTRAAAEGAALIVHAVNPPGYTRWRELAIPMLASTVEAAVATGATILFPANVYVYAPSSGTLVDETAPFAPATRKGQVRLEMETMLAEATRRGARVIGLRAGDFFGPGVENSWFAGAVAKGGWRATVVRDVSIGGAGQSWAYVPDLAEAFARLVDIRDRLSAHAMLHFEGHWCDPGTGMSRAVARALGRDPGAVKPFPWARVRVGAPFSACLRETLEMLWLKSHALRLDNRALERLIGPEPRTPLDVAVARALGPAPRAAIADLRHAA